MASTICFLTFYPLISPFTEIYQESSGFVFSNSEVTDASANNTDASASVTAELPHQYPLSGFWSCRERIACPVTGYPTRSQVLFLIAASRACTTTGQVRHSVSTIPRYRYAAKLPCFSPAAVPGQPLIIAYYNADRVHTRLRDAPERRSVEVRPSLDARVVGSPRLGGLRHRCTWWEAA